MREAIWASTEVSPDPDIIAKLAYDLDRTCRAHQRSLPKGMGGIRREVRAAAAHYLGGPSGYALDPRLKGLPLSHHEHYWWDISTTYLDYVVDTLGQWRNNPKARRVELIPFFQWRRDEDEGYRTQSEIGGTQTSELCACEPEPALDQHDKALIDPRPRMALGPH